MKLNLSMGARNNAKTEREDNDFYATHPSAVVAFLEQLKEDEVKLNSVLWECACGAGHISDVLKQYGYVVYSSDLIDRGYKNTHVMDFLNCEPLNSYYDIITNPPFKYATEFAYRGLEVVQDGHLICLFVKLQFLETKQRLALFKKHPPKFVYIYSDRQHTAKDGDFEKFKCKTQAYCWVIFEKGFLGEPILRWI